MAKVSALEVMPAFNTRSSLGRVVIEPPAKMPALKLRETTPIFMCCGRAFLTEASYSRHQEEVEVHGKPIDLEKLRAMTAKNDRSTLAFWRSRKPKAAMTHEEASIQRKPAEGDSGSDFEDYDDEDNNGNGGEGEMKTEEGQGERPLKYKERNLAVDICIHCELPVPYCNMGRHLRMCHNPEHEFKCRYCSCRYQNEFGRVIHERRNHPNAYHAATRKLKILKKNLIRPSHNKHPRFTAPVLKAAASSSVPITKKLIRRKKFDFQGFKTLNKHAHQCLTCHKVIKGHQTAKDHQNIHMGIKPYSCPVCGYKFTHKTNMTRHLSKGHTGGEYFCENGCGYSFSKPSLMKYHARFCTVTNNQQPSIKHTTPTKSSPSSKQTPKLVKQEPIAKSNFGNGKIPLSTILKWQNNWSQFRKNGHLVCPSCHKQITGAANFRDHLNMHGGIKPYSCSLCTLTFTFKCNIRRHMLQCHVTDGRFPCRFGCGCRMPSMGARTSHESKCAKIKKNDKPSSDIKPSNNKSPQLLVKVKQESLHTSDSELKSSRSNTPLFISNGNSAQVGSINSVEQKTFTCKVCGKWLVSARNLRNHMMIHLNMKPHSCGQCGMRFRSFDQIKKHEKQNHVSTGAYRCSQCPCQFATEQGLKFHVSSRHLLIKKRRNGLLLKKYKPTSVHRDLAINSAPQMPKLIPMGLQTKDLQQRSGRANVGSVHKGPSKHSCTYCDKTFQSSLNLKYHIYSHTGEKPYKCKLCGYHFRRKGTLWDHQKHSHTGGEFRCTECTCRFHSEHGLKRHDSLYHAHNSRMEKSSSKSNIPIINKATTSKSNTNMNIIHKFSNTAATSQDFTATHSGSNATNAQMDRSYSTTAYQFGSTTIAVSVPKDKKYLQHNNHNDPSTTKSDSGSVKSLQNGLTNQNLPDMNSNKSKFGCGHCGLDFGTIHELSVHQMLHTKNDVDEIEIEIEDDTIYTDHTQPNLIVQPETNTRKEPLKRHCPICRCIIHGASHIKKHMNGCHSGGDYRCQKCPCQFHKQHILKKHYTVSHGGDMPDMVQKASEQMQYDSTETGTDFDKSDASSFFQNHFLLGDVTPDIQEDPADESHAVEVRYQYSTSNHHAKTPVSSAPAKVVQGGQPLYQDLPHKCQECGKGFKSNWHLKMHKVVHQTTYDHQCRLCGQNFKTPAHVRMHMKKSHGNGKFKCSKCPSRFDTYRGLQTHTYCYHKGGREIKAQSYLRSNMKRQVRFPTFPKQITNQSHTYVSQSTSKPGMSKVVVPKEPLSKILKESSTYSPKNRPMRCKVCRQICKGPESLLAHMRCHSDEFQEPKKYQVKEFQGSMSTTVEVVTPPSLSPQVDFASNEIQDYSDQKQDEQKANDEFAENEEEDTVIMDYDQDYANGDEDEAIMDSCNEDLESNGRMIQYELDAFNEGNFYAGNGEDDTDDFDVDSYDCEECGLSFTSRVAFLRHIQSSGGGPFKCTYCCAVHATSLSLQGHLELYHEELIAAGH